MSSVRAAEFCSTEEQGDADQSRRPLESAESAPCTKLSGGQESNYLSLAR